MEGQNANSKMVAKLLLRLLPVQILLYAVGSVNGIVSSFFAANYVGVDAMTAVGIYSPVGMLITSIAAVFVGGSSILCGKYIGQNAQKRIQNVFSLNLALSLLVSLVFMAAFLLMSLLDLTGPLAKDPAVRPIFNIYLLGQAIGIIPVMLGSSFASFLSIENKRRRTVIASVTYIVVNVILNFFFLQVLHLEAFGVALASSLGMWVFWGVQAEAFLSGKSHFRMSFRNLSWKDSKEIITIGLPGALTNIYQTARGLIVNHLLGLYVGSVGISAFATANNAMALFWSVPTAMLAVSRMMISVSVGEEDRQTLTDVMRVMFRRFLPLMGAIVLAVVVCAVPLTRIFYRESAGPVYMMTVWGIRLLPLCMPFGIICMHFTCYGQTSGKQALVHVTALFDGVICVSAFTAILIPLMGMNSVYIANILNGIVIVSMFFFYAWVKNRHCPRNMEELMVIPEDFGVSVEERMDLTIKSMEEAISISEKVQAFCLGKGIDARNAYLAGLSMEEMAGNVVDHGFRKDQKKHTVDIRVVHKEDDIILRIKDDCVPFDPGERQKITESDDITKNIGIRMIFNMAKDVQYQNILGLNVLTVRVGGTSGETH